jgi:hypothetical protein
MLAGLVSYVALLDVVGYVLSTCAFLLLEFRLVGVKAWGTNVLLSVGLAASYYIVFVKYFGVAFPKGVFIF